MAIPTRAILLGKKAIRSRNNMKNNKSYYFLTFDTQM